jgi:Arc/MetJ family transcription regulator
MKTLIDVDEDHLLAAQQVLQTTTKKDTVNRALAEVVAIAARRRDLARLRSEDAADLGDVGIMTSAWRR